MRRWFRSLLAGACLAVLPCSVSAFISRVADNPVSDAALRDLRIYIRFEPTSVYAGNSVAQADFRRSAEMGMRMIESLFPTMRVFFVPTQAAANLTFNVGNYNGISKIGCPAGWSGCSYFPDANGNIAGGNIWFNDRGSIQFRHDDFTFFSRDALYGSYVPATHPPDGNGDMDLADGAGYLDGRFMSQLKGEDAAHIIFHEFSHSLGLGHVYDDPLKFYGYPRFLGEPSPAPNRYIVTSDPVYTNLPPQYYGGGLRVHPLTSDLQPMGMYLGHMLALGEEGFPAKPAGVHAATPFWFNSRVVPQDDITHLKQIIDPARILYPTIKGLIRLQQGSSGPFALTNNWTQAINWAQLDRPTVGGQSNPYFVTGVFNAGQTQRLAAASFHTLAVRDDGSLWAWGLNSDGQLGVNYPNSSASPVRIGQNLQGPGLYWVAVAASGNFSLALRSDNALFAWGNRANGQVGDGVFSPTPQTSPKQIPGSWASIKAGGLHALGLKTDGTLWGWGYNARGQLGVGNNTDQASPTQEASRSTEWVAMVAGSNHSMGIKALGTLWAWGQNDNGALGDLGRTSSNRPLGQVYYPRPWILSSAGHEHSAGLSAEGQIYAWGRNQFGQLGIPTANPEKLESYPIASGFVSVGAGNWHTAAIKRDGTVWSWGFNSQGQLGNASVGLGGSSSAMVQEQTGSREWSEVYPGREHTLARKTDGSYWAWGSNGNGQLGDGTTTNRSSPVKVKFGDLPRIKLFTEINGGGRVKAPFTFEEVATSAQPTKSIHLTVEVRGSVKHVQYYNGSTLITTLTSAPYAYYWGPGRGSYTLTARVTDNMGATVASAANTVNIHQIDISIAPAPATVNLSTEGTGDWIQWGYNNSGDFITRKNMTTPLLVVINVPPDTRRYTNGSTGFTWNNGKPTASQTTAQKQYAATSSAGWWSIQAPTSTTTRVTKTYLRLEPGTHLNVGFTVGNGSIAGPALENWGTSTITRVVTVTYAAARPGLSGELGLQSSWFTGVTVGIQAMTYR